MTATGRSAELFLVAERLLVGVEGWFVGGAVRDGLLGRPSGDIDIAVTGNPEPVARSLAAGTGGAVFPLSEEFGAWRVVPRDGSCQFDVSGLVGSSINEDLSRRDFTVNAIARPLSGGDLIDPCGGIDHLRQGRLLPVGPGSFRSDPLRVLRLSRFACELGMVPDREGILLAREASKALVGTASERVMHELMLILGSNTPSAGIDLLDETGALAVILPEVSALKGITQSSYHHLDVYEHTLEVLSRLVELELDPTPLGPAGPSAIESLKRPLADGADRLMALRFGGLLHDIAKPGTRREGPDGRVGFPGHDTAGATLVTAILSRMRASGRFRDVVSALTLHHLDAGFLSHSAPLSPREIHGYLRGCGPVAVDVTVLSVADRLATRGRKSAEAVERHLASTSVLLEAAVEWEAEPLPALVRGDELAVALGIDPGPDVGRALEELEAARYAGEIETREQAIAHAAEWLRRQPGR